MEKSIFTYKDLKGTTEISLVATTDGIVFYLMSVFDTDSRETDTCISKPFPLFEFKRAFDDLASKGKCCLKPGNQEMSIEKNMSGNFDINFNDIETGKSFILLDIHIQINDVMDKLHSLP